MPILPQEVLSNWSLKAEAERFVDEGESCQNWLITNKEGERFIVRNAGNYRKYIEFQVYLMNHLRQKDFPYLVPQPLKTNDGNNVVLTSQGNFYVYPYIDGECLDETLSVDLLTQVGRLVARYDLVVSDISWEGREQLRRRLIFDGKSYQLFEKIVEKLSHKDDLDDVERLFIQTREDIDNLNIRFSIGNIISRYEALPKIPCHGDIFSKNIITKDGQIAGLVDFGGICIESRIFDLQSALDNFCAIDGEIDYNSTKIVMQAYLSVTPLSKEELSLIPMVMFYDVFTSVLWILEERSKPNSRIPDTEAVQRIRLLGWLSKNSHKLEEFCKNHS